MMVSRLIKIPEIITSKKFKKMKGKNKKKLNVNSKKKNKKKSKSKEKRKKIKSITKLKWLKLKNLTW